VGSNGWGLEVRLIGWLGTGEAGYLLEQSSCASASVGGALRSTGNRVITGEQGSSVKIAYLRCAVVMRFGYWQGEFFEGCRVVGNVSSSMSWLEVRLRVLGGMWRVGYETQQTLSGIEMQ